MSSKLASLAKVVYSKAVVARSAPAAVLGPLQKIFGSATPEIVEEESEQQQQEEILETSSSFANERTGQEGGILSALVERAASSMSTVPTPIESPFARQELREFQHDYYRRATATNETQQQEYLQDPDLSVPVGDDYIYLAQ